MEMIEIKQFPITDEDQIAMLVEAGEDGAADLIQELLELFQSEAAPQLEAIRAAVESRSIEAASRPAHALAGSSANLGGLRLSKLAKAMELAANEGDASRFLALAPELESLYGETVEAFEGEIARLRQG